MTGTLYVVSTPIGNLQDMTHRAVETLTAVAAVACEDTRTTAKLLRHWGVRTPTVSYHEHNEAQRTPQLIARLVGGEDIALVSDAGTPLVSDPGYRLVCAARESGLAVRAIPGASALLAALAVSGLPTSSFTFLGFAPARGAPRNKIIASASSNAGTFALFESPKRIAKLLEELAAIDPERPACLLREMTKLHEEHRHGTLSELAVWAKPKAFKGEITLVVGPSPPAPKITVDSLEPSFKQLREEGFSARDAAKRLAKEHGLPARTIYNRFST